MVENKLATKVQTVDMMLKSPGVQARFKEVLGNRAPKFVSSVISALNTNPALKKCDGTSVVGAAMIAASIDLPINQSLGFAYIVPYGGLAQFQIGYKGLIQLAIRTGQYKNTGASIVYKDEFKSWNPHTGELVFTDSSKWKMREKGNEKDILGYAAFFKMINGFEKWLYLKKEEVAAHGKKFSQTYKKGTGRWMEDFDTMALKTVIKMLISKWGMMSVDIQGSQLEKALEADQGVADENGVVEFPDNPSSEAATSLEERKNKVLARARDMGHTDAELVDVVGPFEEITEAKLDSLEDALDKSGPKQTEKEEKSSQMSLKDLNGRKK
jgi:recombination protein RecT